MNLDLSKDYLIWLILPNDKIALLKPKDIKAVNPDNKKHLFTLSMIEDTELEEDQLRKVLDF